MRISGREYFLRVFGDDERQPVEVVTVYRTSEVSNTAGTRHQGLARRAHRYPRLEFRHGLQVAESEEDKSGVFLDVDEHANPISLETLDASPRVAEPGEIEFQTTP